MQLFREFETFNPFRSAAGKLPLAYLARSFVFDTLLYDTASLTPVEHGEIMARAVDMEAGGMLVVWPAADARAIECFSLSHDLVEAYPDIDTVVVAGVGSSPVGTAALARQTANATGRKAVGVIAGYGAADLLAEAIGGWLDFGLANRLRATMDALRMRLPLPGAPPSAAEACKVLSDHRLLDEPETNTLLNLMLRQGERLRLVVGHSKGAVTVQNAASAFVADPIADGLTLEHLHVYTFGCGISLPARFKNVHQHLGTLDLLGWFNTPQAVTHRKGFHWVPGCTHGLASMLPTHMPIETLLPHMTHGARGEVHAIGAGEPETPESGGATIHHLRVVRAPD